MSVVAFRKPSEPAIPETQTALVPSAPASGGMATNDQDLDSGIRRPIMLGTAIVAVFIVGLGIWAALAPLSSAVIATGVVKVEDSRKVVKHRDGGIVGEILVRDGQRVETGQLLLRMDDVQARSAFQVYDNQYMNLIAQRARFMAEGSGVEEIAFPKALTDRASEPAIAELMTDQAQLFEKRRQGINNQVSILQQRLQQLDTRISGYEVQVASIVRQQELIEEELEGTQSLANRGYAPKTQVLALQRASVDLGGQIGQLRSQVAEAGESKGEANMQINRLYEDRLTEGSQGLSDVQAELANILPRLQAAKATLDLTDIHSPTAGTVLGLTQFTEGGVVAAGERILDIVPDDADMIIEATVRPNDIAELTPGMHADVKLTAYVQSTTPSVSGEIIRISADRITNDRGEAFYTADVRVDPASLSRAAQSLRLYPGMPAEVIIPTGERTALDYLISPISRSMDRAFREQ